jgi:hypothetical protein
MSNGLSPTGETTWVVSQTGGRFLLIATNHIPKQQVWPGVDNNHSFMVLLKSHNSLDLEAFDKVSSTNKEKTNKLHKH